MQPQDLLKSQVQAQMVAAKAAAPAAGGVAAKVAPRFTGVGDAAKAIFAERGVVGMTQGLPATVARNVVGVSAYFYGYEAVRKALASRGARRVEDLGFFEVMLAGGFGGCVAQQPRPIRLLCRWPSHRAPPVAPPLTSPPPAASRTGWRATRWTSSSPPSRRTPSTQRRGATAAASSPPGNSCGLRAAPSALRRALPRAWHGRSLRTPRASRFTRPP